jgi:uracil-DNA glycosylase
MSPEEIFQDLKKEALSAFQSRNGILSKEQNWGLSICATPIQIDKGLIMGINWGGGSASDKYEYKVQDVMPTFDDFQHDYNNRDYKFLERVSRLFKDFLGADVGKGEFNYSNLCYFRSPDISYLNEEDYKICLPILKSFVAYVKPEWIVSLSTGNIKYLRKYFPDDLTYETIQSENTSHKAFRGKFLDIPFYNLPHPNARRLSNETYYAIWKNVFSDVKR